MSEKKKETVSYNPKEVLTYIIKLAKKSGFSYKNLLDEYDSFIITSFNVETGRMVFVFRSTEELRVVYDSIYTLFFDITFARAIFGDCWDVRLVELAKAEDKLKYLALTLKIPFNDGTNDEFRSKSA